MGKKHLSTDWGPFHRARFEDGREVFPEGSSIAPGEVFGTVFANGRRPQAASASGNLAWTVGDQVRVRLREELCEIEEATPSTANAARKPAKGRKRAGRTAAIHTHPDLVDFRDKLYTPTLVEVAPEITLQRFHDRVSGISGAQLPVLDQGEEGACTGFALATVAHYLLRTRSDRPDQRQVSPHMLYDLARKYDEWPGEDYSGSSARGTMKAWHKHGICSKNRWKPGTRTALIAPAIVDDALHRPLGAYFRVNHKDLVSMHSAISETGILFATLDTHEGWSYVNARGSIRSVGDKYISGGGHAVAIVGYDKKGFWFQNSWGEDWGAGGYGHITYDDWLTNGWDVWAARLGAPVDVKGSALIATEFSAIRSTQGSLAVQSLRPHIISVGNNGHLGNKGTFANTAEDVADIFTKCFPDITAGWGRKDKKKRLLIYAHGGLVNEDAAVQRLADYRPILLKNEIYPVSFIWHSGIWETMGHLLQDNVRKRKSEGAIGDAFNFVLDKMDGMIEAVTSAPGRGIWSEMKENALGASTDAASGAARIALREIKRLRDSEIKKGYDLEMHFVGHSAGSIFLAPLVQWWSTKGTIPSGPLKGETGLGLPTGSLTFWAPAITTTLFSEACLPLITREIDPLRFNLYLMDDRTEQNDHCAGLYHKSLLYLVSNAFESARVRPDGSGGEPLLGMEKWLKRTALWDILNETKGTTIVLSPDKSNARRCNATEHGAFDDDEDCTRSTLEAILGAPPTGSITHSGTATSKKDQRGSLSA